MKKRKTVVYASSWLPMTMALDVQVEACQKFAEEQGLTVSDVYQDFNRDTTPLRERRHFSELYAAVKRGEIKRLLITTRGRLGRDKRATAKLLKEFKGRGVVVLEVWKEEQTQ